MQSAALSYTVWGCGPSKRPGPAQGLGKSAQLPRHGSGQGVGRHMECHCPHSSSICCLIRQTLPEQRGQIQRLKQKIPHHLFQKHISKCFEFSSPTSAELHLQKMGVRRSPVQQDMLQIQAQHKCLLNEQHLPYLHHNVKQSEVSVSYRN